MAGLIMTPAGRTLVIPGNPEERYVVPQRRNFIDPDWLEDGGDERDKNAPLRATCEARELARIAGALVRKYEDLKHLRDAAMEFRWKRKGGGGEGSPKFYGVIRVGGIWRDLLDWDWLVWLAADHLRHATKWQVEAALHDALQACGEDEKHRPVIIKPEVVGYAKGIERYGCYTTGLIVGARALGQLQLPLQRALPTADPEQVAVEAAQAFMAIVDEATAVASVTK